MAHGNATLTPRQGSIQSFEPKNRRLRLDIQALRALAVGLVVIYHFWPLRLTGGFVGVDVFFVISGFLITTHLLGRPPTNARHLISFWAKRVSRLLPAATLVLVISAAAVMLFLPLARWDETALHLRSAAIAMENWRLASQSIDYSAADTQATVFQHFWSLAVEEQFYLMWPVLILCAVLLGRKKWMTVSAFTISSIVVISLTASIYLTESDAAAAYFVTWTRVWELGMGGLLAHIVTKGNVPAFFRTETVRNLLAWAGLALIIFSAIVFDASTPFPGSAALLPVLGTVAIVIANTNRSPLSFRHVGDLKFVQLIGDNSYAIYLWHWPILIIATARLGDQFTWKWKILLIATAIVIAVASTRYFETPFRSWLGRRKSQKRIWSFAVGSVAAVVILSLAMQSLVAMQISQAQKAFERSAADSARCLASAQLMDPTCEGDPHGESLLTDPTFIQEDKPAPYGDDCIIQGDFSNQKTCTYGSTSPDAKRIALVGNSHAIHWLPALQKLATTQNWNITTYLISECYTSDAVLLFDSPIKQSNCRVWNDFVQKDVAAQRYDLVVSSNRHFQRVEGAESFDQSLNFAEASFQRILKLWQEAEVPVLVIHDTPYASNVENVPDCIATATEPSACDGNRDREVADPFFNAAKKVSSISRQVRTLDLTSGICKDSTCYSQVGGVIVYFDRGHLSATFAESFAPAILEEANLLLKP